MTSVRLCLGYLTGQIGADKDFLSSGPSAAGSRHDQRIWGCFVEPPVCGQHPGPEYLEARTVRYHAGYSDLLFPERERRCWQELYTASPSEESAALQTVRTSRQMTSAAWATSGLLVCVRFLCLHTWSIRSMSSTESRRGVHRHRRLPILHMQSHESLVQKPHSPTLTRSGTRLRTILNLEEGIFFLSVYFSCWYQQPQILAVFVPQGQGRLFMALVAL